MTTEDLRTHAEKLRNEIAGLVRKLEAFDEHEVSEDNTVRKRYAGRLTEAQAELERAEALLHEAEVLDNAEKGMSEGTGTQRKGAAMQSVKLKYQRAKREADDRHKPQTLDFGSGPLTPDRELLNEGENA